MNKTISIHLQGVPFIIEEHAFELLRNYLERLKFLLKNQKGSEEIIQDVELRMAELFSKKISGGRQVIEAVDVEEILALLGNPEVFADDDNMDTSFKESTNAKEENENIHVEKRLFRDEENGILGGVCAGFASYLGMDIVIIRAIMVLLFIFGGFGFPLYIILWIITPRAKTSYEKLQMKGKPVTLEHIKSEIEDAADNIQKKSKAWGKKLREENTALNGIKAIIRVISVAIGIFMILSGIGIFIMSMVFIFGDPELIPAQINGEFMSLGKFGELVAENQTDMSYFFYGILITSLSAVGLFWLGGIRLIVSYGSKWFKYASGTFTVLMIVGIVLLSLMGAKTGRAFAIHGELEKELYAVNANELNLVFETSTHVDAKGYKTVSHGDMGVLKVVKNKIFFHGVHVQYRLSSDSLYHVKELLSSQGHDHHAALEKARNIEFKTWLTSNQLHVSTYYKFPLKDKLRDQNVKLIIDVPQGKYVKFRDKVVYPYYDQEKGESDEERMHGYVHGNGEYETW